MKKVLIITNHSFMFWQFRRELVSTMVEQGYQVTLAVPFGDRVKDLRGLGCELIDTPMDRRSVSPIKELVLYRQYRQIIRQLKPDVVVTYSIKPNVYGGRICSNLGIPYCVNVQGLGTAFQKPSSAWVASGMYRMSLKHARVVFFENQANAVYFRERGIVPAEKQMILNGAGINLDFYARKPYPGNEPVHFLYLGRVMREKGVEELFTAVRRLHREGYPFFLDVVGFFEDEYADQVAELEEMGICRFYGFQMDARPYYEAADCVVLPSYHEGMSNVLLEAAAIGRPLITSDIPGCREAVDEGVSGFTCPVKNADALYETMKRFLSLSPEQRAEMGNAGHRKMRAQFDRRDVIAQTLGAVFGKDAREVAVDEARN